MHPISSAQKENILSLASHGHSTHSIAKKTGLGKSTVIKTLHNILPNHQMPSSGHPSSRAQHAILSVTIYLLSHSHTHSSADSLCLLTKLWLFPLTHRT